MPISVKCPHCEVKLTVKDELQGRTVKCPKCEGKIKIEEPEKLTRQAVAETSALANKTASVTGDLKPKSVASKATSSATTAAATAAPSRKKSGLPTDPEERYRALQPLAMRAFEGEIEPVRSPFAYRAGMLLALFVMILLPLIYVALIGLVGYGIYWHAISNTGIFKIADETRGRNSGRAMVFALMVYAAPILVGAILVAFMLKPLFSKPERTRKPRTLSREKEPLLFAFIDRLCDAVHAPRPTQIDVDLEVNASASFRNGIWSLFGSDLKLTLGLPLIAGLPLRNLAGVLAHEFGHFAQGAGMRVTFIVRSISYWFARVVYERDHWDATLEEWSRDNDIRIGWLFYLARFFVWLTRRVLWLLMMIGNVVSCLMLRQMEFDADRYESRMSGSKTFAETARSLRLIGLADQQSWANLNDQLREGRLIDDMPRFTLANFRKLPKEAHEFVDKLTGETKTGWFDTHPSDLERNRNALAEDTDGIMKLSRPSMDLFRDFAALSRATTVDLYKAAFESNFDPKMLYSVDETLARLDEETSAHDGLRRYFQLNFTFHRPMSFSNTKLSAPEDADAAIAELKEVRQQFDEAATHMLPLTKSYRDAAQKLAEMSQARELISRGIKLPDGFSTERLRKVADIEVIEADQQEIQEKLTKRLDRWDSICNQRLLLGLNLLFDARFDEQIEEVAQHRKHCTELIHVMNLLSLQFATIKDFVNANGVIGALVEVLSKDEKNETVSFAIREQARNLAQPIKGVHAALGRRVYPFASAKEDMTIADYAFSEPPHIDDLQGQWDASQRLAETVTRLYSRALGQLCLYAEEVETAIGLTPLETPSDED